ncbi:MAG: tetraacyldisaccharide 4'-kinase [Candidatus Omnitrophica bacterium]|nr:tetraacyldisaccharide 4'-kinase [Candidatus Omnitrophota bacterium]
MNGLLLFSYQVFLAFFGAGYLVVRVLRGRGIPGLRQRLGWYSEPVKQWLEAHPGSIWIHLVSVGEVIAAKPLIESLRGRLPDRSWIITTVTPTGRSVAKGFLREGKDQLLYLPWDFSPVIGRAVRRIHPSLFIAFETELWPVLFNHLNREGVPIFVVNGRISPAAYRRYLWARPFFRKTLAKVNFFLTQSAQDARRYAALGAPKDRIAVTGNLKWDLAAPQGAAVSEQENLRLLLKLSPRSVLWTAASTHPGEEELILQVYRNLKRRFPNLRLLIAPRHPERVPEVEKEVREAGLSSVRRTALEGTDGSEKNPVILLDTLGELTSFYRVSDLTFVGGSLVPHGGHNLIEPAFFSRPILTGSYLQNFQSVAESLSAAGGIAVVKSVGDLEERLGRLLENPALREELGKRAFSVIREHRGATERTVELILRKSGQERGSSRGSPHPLRFFLPFLAVGAVGYRVILSGIGILYRRGILKTHRLPVPVVSVGNLTWGGTGKTPFVMQLTKSLQEKGRAPAVLTRGYGPDETRLLTERLQPIPVLVGPDRITTGNRAIQEFGADLLVLDDGYQQWRLRKDLEILLVDSTAPFGNGHLLPWGSLREPRAAASRANLIVVTKADLNPNGLNGLEAELRRLNPSAPIFFARYKPLRLWEWPSGKKIPLGQIKTERICSLAGIARPESFEASLEALGAGIAMKYRVGDHHPYTVGEMVRLMTRCQRHGIRRIVTTAKDAVRIPNSLLETVGPDLKGLEFWVLEVELEFEPDESELLHRIDTLLPR